MKILHTSDWHIGHKLYGRRRTSEFADFFNWLIELIEKQNIDALIVAGDIFDSQAPSNLSLELYYSFLSSVSQGCCRHIVITGGNHDSPALLEAPGQLLRSLHIHVVARVPDNIGDEIIVLRNADNAPELIVLAVPYLRDREIRSSDAGESCEDKQQKLLHGIYNHYATLCERAEKIRNKLNPELPLLATGHLFCRGGKTHNGDGVRELYIGNLVQVGLDCFPEAIDYLALGHLHSAQLVGKMDTRRYSGSPLAMTFNETENRKRIIQIEFTKQISISEITIPCFQKMCRISGDIEHLLKKISALAEKDESILLEVEYTGIPLIENLREQVSSATEGSSLEILRLQNKHIYNHILQQNEEIKSLDDLTPEQVFTQCLINHQIPSQQQKEMLLDFAEILALLAEIDPGSESAL